MTSSDENTSSSDRGSIHETRARIVKSLVEDFDASPDLAEAAALKVEQEHIDEYPDLDELVEFVHDSQEFWD